MSRLLENVYVAALAIAVLEVLFASAAPVAVAAPAAAVFDAPSVVAAAAPALFLLAAEAVARFRVAEPLLDRCPLNHLHDSQQAESPEARGTATLVAPQWLPQAPVPRLPLVQWLQ